MKLIVKNKIHEGNGINEPDCYKLKIVNLTVRNEKTDNSRLP